MSRTATATRTTATPGHRRAATPAARARRVSGPVAPPRPRPVPAPAPAGAAAAPRLIDAGIERVRGLPDSGFLDTLLRSRAWIWLIGVLLGGIVAMQVSLLKLNSGIGRAVETTATLERHNAGLEAQIARLSSGERIRLAAQETGMVMPDAGQIGYLSIRPGDARRAAARMQAPTEEARALLANGGIVPGSLMAPTDPTAVAPVTPTDPTAVTPADPTVTATEPTATTTEPTATTPATDPTATAPATGVE